jgi:hypothetical protein
MSTAWESVMVKALVFDAYGPTKRAILTDGSWVTNGSIA